MTGQQKIEIVLRKIILPYFPMLTDVEVRVHGGTWEMYFYTITYFSEKKLNRKLMEEIETETMFLFQMIGETNSDFTIYFKERE